MERQSEYSEQELQDRNIMFFLQSMRTGVPGKILSTDGKKATIQPLVDRLFKGKPVRQAVLTDVPLWRLGTQAARVSVPINPKGGDFCVINFCERPIDTWVVGDGTPQVPKDGANHDERGAWALVGLEPFQSDAINMEDLVVEMNRGTSKESSIYLKKDGSIIAKSPKEIILDAPKITIKAGTSVKVDTPLTEFTSTEVKMASALTFDLSTATEFKLGKIAAIGLIIGGPLDHIHTTTTAPANGVTTPSAPLPAP